MLEPIKYERRFKTTVFHVVRPSQLQAFSYPEISPYNHAEFEEKINYVYFVYALKGLIKMPHVQILQKVITFIYCNEDFFNGKHRLTVRFVSASFLVIQGNHFPQFLAFFHSLESKYSPYFSQVAYL